MGAEMNFKIGDRVKVSTIEDVGEVMGIKNDKVSVSWNHIPIPEIVTYPAYQVRLAGEEPARLSRKEIRKELKKFDDDNRGNLMGLQTVAAIAWLEVEHPKRNKIRARLRQLSAEAFCVDKVLAERIDKIADGV
jgi:hypothetical protein